LSDLFDLLLSDRKLSIWVFTY